MDDQRAANRPAPASPAPVGMNAYAAAFAGGIPESERRRLDLQVAVYGRLSAWTFDALGLAIGQRVADIGCGSGVLLAELARRVGPAGRVVGVERDPRLAAVARERAAAFPWVEVIEDDALTYDPGAAPFDAVHCRLVLIHQRDPEALLARMVALARPGGRVAAQEVDADGPTGAPALNAFPPFPALERLGAAYLTTSLRRGTDAQLGRKLPARFAAAGLTALQTEAQAVYTPLADPRASIMLDLFARAGAGADAETHGVLPAADYDALLAEVQAARHDPARTACVFRLWTVVATVGTKPNAPRSDGA